MVSLDAVYILYAVCIGYNRDSPIRNIGDMGMTETKEREAYRKRCRHYGAEGDCHKQSHAERIYGYYFAVDIACTPDCDCARMKRFDKRKKG